MDNWMLQGTRGGLVTIIAMLAVAGAASAGDDGTSRLKDSAAILDALTG